MPFVQRLLCLHCAAVSVLAFIVAVVEGGLQLAELMAPRLIRTQFAVREAAGWAEHIYLPLAELVCGTVRGMLGNLYLSGYRAC